MNEVEKAKAKLDEMIQKYQGMQKEIQQLANDILKAQGVYEYELKKNPAQPELPLEEIK